MSCVRFGLKIINSTFVILVLMYLNTCSGDHMYFSQIRTWMAVVIGATMSVIVLSFMWSMHMERRRNIAILVASVLEFKVSLWLVRRQVMVNDVSCM